MKKIAIFVEGQTEQLFVEKVLTEIAGKKNICVEKKRWRTNSEGNRSFIVVDAGSKTSGQKYYVLIYDCGSDSCVKSDIRDSYEGLERQMYVKILGLRDVYPENVINIPKLEMGLKYKIRTKPIPVNIILAVMETEAWFLGETTHFSKIHPSITISRIKAELNFDPSIDDVEKRQCPHKDLHDIYHLAGFAYRKKRNQVQRTVEVLDYGELYFSLPNRIKNLKKFIEHIDEFLR